MDIDMILPLMAYLFILFCLSFYSVRNQKSEHFLKQYFIGNRSMGGFVLAMTLSGTYISASSFIGGPGAAYQYGLGWVLLAMIQLPAIWLSLGILGKKFAILARSYNAVTLNDMLYARYKSRLLVWLTSVSLLLAFMGAMTVQFVGGARLLEATAGIPYHIGLLIFGISVTLYTAFGGFRSSVLNDSLQGVIMLSGTILLLVAVVHNAGGLAKAVDTLFHIDPALITPQGQDQILNIPFMASFWVLVCFGVIGLPHTAVRSIAYRNSQAVHRGIILGTVVVGIMMFTMHLSGALGRAILPDLSVPDEVIPKLIMRVFPPFAAGLFLAAPMAAIMSTVNAQLLQSSATLVKDIYLNLKPKQLNNEKKLKWISKGTTLCFGLLLILTAWRPPDMIIWLNLLAFGGMEAVFLWPLVLGLYWRRANAYGAISSMIVGALCYILLTIFNIQFLGFHPIMPTLILNLLAFLMGNIWGDKKTLTLHRDKTCLGYKSK
ncbi:sodium/pantothenate symporter [Candidatus Hamiltonella defensa]|uniref:Sodium/pantothenate symporter n=1 Tax=Candidatus Williamhamiltonella defendens TaxID=138072 RepID=A0AAC9YG75_9ENTR|nr:sodium/pantothenate symporter [Candidatus Hamiltonella defensa]ASV34391.1 sodium/panthothenate symporter [Candidatus Hamiltonella defensa]MBK4360800.1 sodium/pantothenate symporter [Candidatus Hamiltonella defensa]